MLVMQYVGGLGNQLFEYAFYRALICKGKRVLLDNSFFVSKAWAYAIGEFPNIKMKPFRGFHNYPYYVAMGMLRKLCKLTHFCYSENVDMPYDEGAFRQDRGLITGYYQNEYYFRDISVQIRHELKFPDGESKLQKRIAEIDYGEYVSIHVRRKDYLELSDIYGGICDDQYYREAIKIMESRHPNAKFMVFSDDSSWVKNNMEIPNAEYVSQEDFENYEDWYDMCLMSHCKHNIIANSTFSWWGGMAERQCP